MPSVRNKTVPVTDRKYSRILGTKNNAFKMMAMMEMRSVQIGMIDTIGLVEME